MRRYVIRTKCDITSQSICHNRTKRPSGAFNATLFRNICRRKFLESYTIIDSNQDGTKWEPYFGKVQISYNSELAMDDWLITPALNLEGGKMYSFSVNILTGNETTQETFEIMFGKDKTPEALVNPIIEKLR